MVRYKFFKKELFLFLALFVLFALCLPVTFASSDYNNVNSNDINMESDSLNDFNKSNTLNSSFSLISD